MAVPGNGLKAALARGEMQVGLWLGFAHPVAAEIAGQAGFDWCLIDGEHGPNDIPLILAQLQALAGGTAAPVVRVPAGEPRLLKQVLDLGAQSVLVPMVESAEAATALVAAVRYPPRGMRGVGAVQARATRYGEIGDYIAGADDQICLMVQVESRGALAAIDAIAAIAGVDVVFLGPADLSADMGFPGRPDAPEVVSAIAEGVAKVRAAGKAAGIITLDPAVEAAYYRDLGVTFLATGGDVASYSGAIRRLAAESQALKRG